METTGEGSVASENMTASRGTAAPPQTQAPAEPAAPTTLVGKGAVRDFALVVPAFNEIEVVQDLVRELREAWKHHGLGGEVIVVDDGSTDGTGTAVESEADGWSLLKVLRHPSNRGKTEAIVSAVAATKRKYIVIFDADLQHSPNEIPRFLAKLDEGWDMVTGRKIGSYDKKVVSGVYNRLSRRLFAVPVSDLNSMKAFRRSAIEGLTLRHDWHRFFVVLAHARGASVTEIDIELHSRRAGTSKYRGLGRVVVGTLDLASVAFLLFFSRKPLLLFGSVGLGLGFAGALVATVTLYLRFVHGGLGFEPFTPSFGYRPLLYLTTLLVTVGSLLVGFGLVSEQVAQLRQEVETAARKRDK